MMIFKKALKRVLGGQMIAVNEFRSNRFNRMGISSYGQEGEDRVLASLLFMVHGRQQPSGFYVDVGAHDPFRFSNTYLFYRLGWSGINIDAAPGSMRKFAIYRSRDLNLELGVGRESSTATFYLLNEPALNTFDFELAKARSVPPRKIIGEVHVRILPLRDIFSQYLKNDQHIDFLTIDVEGRDIDVLHSNDWQKYRPSIVVVEIFGKSIAEALEDPTVQYLKLQRYVLYSKTVNTAFFVDGAISAINRATG